MVVKVYISGISGNKEVKKRQQRVLLILESKNIPFEVIDIAEPGSEDAKDFMQNNSTSSGGTISDPNPRHPLPPQIFNEDVYCGDYEAFDLANEVDEMEKFLKIENCEITTKQQNGADIERSDENTQLVDEVEEGNKIENVMVNGKENGSTDINGEDAIKEEETNPDNKNEVEETKADSEDKVEETKPDNEDKVKETKPDSEDEVEETKPDKKDEVEETKPDNEDEVETLDEEA